MAGGGAGAGPQPRGETHHGVPGELLQGGTPDSETLLQHIPWFVSHPAEGEVCEEVKPGLRMKFNIDR